MLPTRLWRCELRRFVSAAGWRACFRLFTGLARHPPAFCGFLLRCCVSAALPGFSPAPLLVFVCPLLFFSLPACFLLFASVLSCLRYFVVVNGGLYPFIFQGFLLYWLIFWECFCA